MKAKMILITALFLVGFAVSFPVFLVTKNDIAEIVAITMGVTLYHFVMRLAVGAIVNAIMKNEADHDNAWFREKSFERSLYRRMRIRAWGKYLSTYDPDAFDTGRKTVKEIIGASCQAEVVHEVIMVLSLLPILLIPLLKGAAAFIITSVLAMLYDSLFVMLQRYNRPKLVRVMHRFQKLRSEAE